MLQGIKKIEDVMLRQLLCWIHLKPQTEKILPNDCRSGPAKLLQDILMKIKEKSQRQRGSSDGSHYFWHLQPSSPTTLFRAGRHHNICKIVFWRAWCHMIFSIQAWSPFQEPIASDIFWQSHVDVADSNGENILFYIWWRAGIPFQARLLVVLAVILQEEAC